MEEATKTAQLVKQEIDNSLSTLFNKDHRFHPHLTVARVKYLKDKEQLIKKLESFKIENETFDIKSFQLNKSILTSNSPIYKVVENYLLK